MRKILAEALFGWRMSNAALTVEMVDIGVERMCVTEISWSPNVRGFADSVRPSENSLVRNVLHYYRVSMWLYR